MFRIIAYGPFIILLALLVYFGLSANTTSFVASLFGAATSLVALIFLEAELRPDIQILKEAQPAFQPDGGKFLRVVVKNRPLWRPLNLIMDRRPAYQARAWITFLTDTNNLVFSPGRRMLGRWSLTPEPVRPILATSAAGQPPGLTFLWDLTATTDVRDIPSGGQEILDLVMRRPGESGCRGWHNRMIGLDTDKVPPDQRFELEKGRYHALLQVDASGRSFKALFRIVCDVGLEDFRLEPLPQRLTNAF